MSENSIQKIVIVGGGSAGWMTAAMLSNQLQGNCQVTLIESQQIGTIGVGEATIPPIKVFNNLLGIKENDFLSQCNGSIKLGIRFENWLNQGHDYFHQFGRFGADFDYTPFPYFWLESVKQGNELPLQEYSPAWHMAKHNKFIPPAQDKRSLFSGMDYAYHFDAGLYAAFLKNQAIDKGVTAIDGIIEHVDLNETTGFIESVRLQSGETHSADLFIDCSGIRSLLLGQSLNVDFIDWSEHLLCDSAVAAQTTHTESIKPYTRSIAHHAGWQWRIPLQSRMGNGNVFSSKFMSDDEATELLTSTVTGELLTEPRVIKFTPGRREKFWHKNCVAVGLSAGFLEPLESTSLHLIQRSIMRLLAYFPDKSCSETNTDRYNQVTVDEYEHIRDFIILHYKATERDDSDFWQYCRNMSIPDSLAERMALFAQDGHLLVKDNELFKHDSWLAVLTGQGVMPKQSAPIMAFKKQVDVQQTLAAMHQNMTQTVTKIPSHEMYLAKNCRFTPK